jgi:hypothetical protein
MISTGLAAALHEPEQMTQAHLTACCSAAELQAINNAAVNERVIEMALELSEALDDEPELSNMKGIAANSVGSMNSAVIDAEPQLPGLETALSDEQFESTAWDQQLLEEPWQLLPQQQQQQAVQGAVGDHPQQQKQQQQKQPTQKQKNASKQGNKQQPPSQQQQQQQPQAKAQHGRWSLGKLGSGLFRREGRTLLQTMFPEGLTKLSMEQLYPGLATSSDPNMPFGTGRMGQFMNGLLGNTMNSGGMMRLVGGLAGPSMGGPIATGRFNPVVNTQGNIVNTGTNPGGLMVRTGPGGVTTGAYGGGWAGPYNTATGQYGIGGNYGFSRPYHGRAQGSAMVTVPAWVSPNSPNVTYPCPVGRGNGSIIAPGVPCGIAITSVPASMLPTMNGMPAAVDITALSVSWELGTV